MFNANRAKLSLRLRERLSGVRISLISTGENLWCNPRKELLGALLG